MTGEIFIDVDSCCRSKAGQAISGDVFLSRRIREEGRIVSVLSDGLGSGVKAGVLANLTATMALRYSTAFVDVRRSAGIIMDTLPICQVRKISYSTFTIVDIEESGRARVIEHGNPALLLVRAGRLQKFARTEFRLENWKERMISFGEFQVELNDRIVCFSDGISQSGLGRPGFPFGWGSDRAARFVCDALGAEPDVPASRLARMILDEALGNDGQVAKDDMTCAVVHYRSPRRLLVITGPPYERERDSELAELVLHHPGRKVICGGTTANIVSRLLRRPVRPLLGKLDSEIPPAAEMEGIELVTEGTITLARVAEMLEHGEEERGKGNPACELRRLMIQSDVVEFIVGTRINEAHQDPNVPVELDLRRNVIRRIAALLESKHLKECRIRFL